MTEVISEWAEIINRLEIKDPKAATRLITEHIHKWTESYKAGIMK